MASTADGFFAPLDRSQFWISSQMSKRLVHRWRMEVDAVLVGTTTAWADNPRLDNRHYYGKSPLRIVLDRNLSLPQHLHLFADGHPTLIVTALAKPVSAPGHLQYVNLPFNENFWADLFTVLWQEFKLGMVLIEGGEKVLQSVLAAGLWDETRVLVGPKNLSQGIPTPIIPGSPEQVFQLGKDHLMIYKHSSRS
jgi:diaminohydroxyphosphoribosylaminopyrimidine deaminase/5-amino-6-(5-phosphoribosylamino)uracil reductase